MSHKLRPLAPDMKLAGPAFTIKGTVTCERDEAGRHKRIGMITQMTAPCIEVRDRGTPFNVDLYGELSATTARAHGAAGALIDGATRDSLHLVAMGFPVFARFRNPVEAFGRYMMVACAGLGWYRTCVDVPERGGALVSEFDNEAAAAQGLTEWGEVGEQRIWNNLEYFLKAVMPVAERAGVRMALPPDDPPISPLSGIARILTSAASFRRVLEIARSPVNGITSARQTSKPWARTSRR